MDEIRNYIEQIEMENLELTHKIQKSQERIEMLLKWIYLMGGSGVLLSVIEPETVDYYYENKEKYDGNFEDIIHQVQIKLQLKPLEDQIHGIER